MKMRVLVFEDDELIRTMLQRSIERLGCEVRCYAHPALCPLLIGGLRRCELQQTCADAVISDLNMPGMDGVELISRLQEGGCGLRRCLLASGNWSTEAAARARALGCAVVDKPFEPEAIHRWIVECRDGLVAGRVLSEWNSEINPTPKAAP